MVQENEIYRGRSLRIDLADLCGRAGGRESQGEVAALIQPRAIPAGVHEFRLCVIRHILFCVSGAFGGRSDRSILSASLNRLSLHLLHPNPAS